MGITGKELRRRNKLIMAEKHLALRFQAAICEHVCLDCNEFQHMSLSCAPKHGRRYKLCNKCYEEKAREFSKTTKGKSLMEAYNEASERLVKWRAEMSKK